ncbi:MAG: hypothetical protein E6Q78_05190 [Rhodoferax sp.]|nr:MAG: hypothetical protein E6Q78_05190 [Rhodoferax sp.]
MSNTNHPLANIPKERIELAIAQALTELCNQWADVTLEAAQHTGGVLTAGESSLQVSVSFRARNPEEGEAEH